MHFWNETNTNIWGTPKFLAKITFTNECTLAEQSSGEKKEKMVDKHYKN